MPLLDAQGSQGRRAILRQGRSRQERTPNAPYPATERFGCAPRRVHVSLLARAEIKRAGRLSRKDRELRFPISTRFSFLQAVLADQSAGFLPLGGQVTRDSGLSPPKNPQRPSFARRPPLRSTVRIHIIPRATGPGNRLTVLSWLHLRRGRVPLGPTTMEVGDRRDNAMSVLSDCGTNRGVN